MRANDNFEGKKSLLKNTVANPNALFNKAGRLMLERKWEEALNAFDLYLQIDPTDEVVLENCIVCSSVLHKFSSCVNYWEAYQNIEPDNYLRKLGYVEALIQDNKKEQAHKILLRLLEDHPAYAPLLCALSDFEVQRNQVGKALGFLKKAVTSDPNSIEVLLSMGKLYFNADQSVEALQAFEALAKLDKNNPEVWFYLFNIYKDCGALEESKPLGTPEEMYQRYECLLEKGAPFR